MSTSNRPELRKHHKYWISRHRFYELKHFCLQYWEFKKDLLDLSEEFGLKSPRLGVYQTHSSDIFDPTGKIAVKKAGLERNINLIEKTAKMADESIDRFIFKSVTEGYSFVALQTKYEIPCGKDFFYDRYRKFFWLLSDLRG